MAKRPTRLSTKSATIGERSTPEIGGITFLNTLRYGSTILPIASRMFLTESFETVIQEDRHHTTMQKL
jgi:hypothetical protein